LLLQKKKKIIIICGVMKREPKSLCKNLWF